jgi:1-acyl-sn-glycerol-3-phosphate acyltransferase
MIDYYVRTRVVGGEVFDRLSHPVIFVANHSSHLDTPTILRALPRKWRRNTAVAAAADYFYNKRWKANGVALLFNTVPLGRKGGGLGNGATDHVDRLIDDGWNLVMFPEGTRSRDGEVGKVRSGAAVIPARGRPTIGMRLWTRCVPSGSARASLRLQCSSPRTSASARQCSPADPLYGPVHPGERHRVEEDQ